MQASQSSPPLIDGLNSHNGDQKPWTHRLDYTAIGGNRHPAAADWDPVTGIVAFGSGNNIAIWRPVVSGGYLIPFQVLPSAYLVVSKMIGKVSRSCCKVIQIPSMR